MKPDPPKLEQHPTQSASNPFPRDQYLRDADPPFRLARYGRPEGRQSVWERFVAGEWVQYIQSEAVAIVDEESPPTSPPPPL